MRFLASLCLFLLVSCGGGGGGGSSPRPDLVEAWNLEWAENMPRHPVATHDGWALELPTPQAEPHYVTTGTGSLVGKTLIRMTYRVEGGPIVPAKEPLAPSIITLYFQRAGDNWSGLGEFESYRWYASFASQMPITAGDHVLEARLDANWTAVMTSSRNSNPQGFQSALENAARVGFALGGGDGLGHGVRAQNPSRIVVTSFEVK